MELLQQISCFVIWLIVVPMLVGVMPALVIERKNKTLGTIYLTGWLTMGAVFQLLAVPFILTKRSLTDLNFTFSAVMEILAVCGLLILVIGIAHDGINEFIFIPKKSDLKNNLLYWILFGALYLFQLIMSVCMMTPDGDDAYYIVHAVIADQQNLMYLKNAYTGWHGALDTRYVLSPFPMFYATLARKSGISATIVAHTIMPLILITITYLIYYKFAVVLFEKEKDRIPIFMILISAIQLFGNTSLYTNETFFLTRTWQGKSILANIVLPAVLYIMYMISKYTEDKVIDHNSRILGWFFILFMTNLVGALASSLGLLLLIICEGVCSILVAVRNRKLWVLPSTLAAIIPCIIYILIYKFK